MPSPIDEYFLHKPEPVGSCLQYLRQLILETDTGIAEQWKYGMPFYAFMGKRFCYLWIHKKKQLPYLGIVDGKRVKHPALQMEKRSRMSILLIDPAEDIPVADIKYILNEVLVLVK